MSDIIKPSDSPPILRSGKLRSTSSPFQERLKQATANVVDPSTLPHRICLMLDKSSSMTHVETRHKSRIELLKDAVEAFVNTCNFNDTAIAVETFPESIAIGLSNDRGTLLGLRYLFDASGNTPMRQCVEKVLKTYPISRGILVSDGEATDWYNQDEILHDDESYSGGTKDPILTQYKDAGIPIDCVHISLESRGEELLRRIAKETGGIFMKFTDVSAFSRAFGVLAPSRRPMLTNGSISASSIGAREIQK